MKYRNRETGVVVEPASELAAQTFQRNPDWEPADGAMKSTVAGGPPPEKTPEEMTIPELKALSAKLGLALDAQAKKADIVTAVKAAQAQAAGPTTGSAADGGGPA